MREESPQSKSTDKEADIHSLVKTAFFIVFTAACSQISIPLPFTPVPLNCALLSVFLSGHILGSKKGALSQFAYILLGCAGFPVFAGFSSGVGIIAGPTGGYLAGYILASFIIGFFKKDECSLALTGLSMALGLFACYFLGTAWFAISTGAGFLDALLMCVIPFIPGDAVKIICACVLIKRFEALHLALR
jgi:biotin transport system substrate-specific component